MSSSRGRILAWITLALFWLPQAALAAGAGGDEMAWPQYDQKAEFPKPLAEYEPAADAGIWEIIVNRAQEDWFNVAATAIFVLAIVHTFLAGWFNKLAHQAEVEHDEQIRQQGRTADQKRHDDAVDDVSLKATVLHFFGEVEAIFGIWVLVLGAVATARFGFDEFVNYVNYDRNYIEPMFVVVIMAISASRPVIRFSEGLLSWVSSGLCRVFRMPEGSPIAWWWSILTVAPLLGSFITEPAAMTIAAMLLGKRFYRLEPAPRFAYATLGLLFVNISVGGTMTFFAAPPVLMIAEKWGFNEPFLFMFQHFGYKAIIGIIVANLLYYFAFRGELRRMCDTADGVGNGVVHPTSWREREDPIPKWVIIMHLLFLGWTVFVAHDPVLFIGGFLFFLAFVTATEHHQNSIHLKGPVLVGFFLASLIIHGGLQGWWIEPILKNLGELPLQAGATILTAFNDNAAITYLASQVPGLSDGLKYAVVAGAVIGGGLTVIANAPNPAGQSLLRRYFGGNINPGGLAAGAIVPTLIMFACFSLMPHLGSTMPGVDNPTGGGEAIHHVDLSEDTSAEYLGEHTEQIANKEEDRSHAPEHPQPGDEPGEKAAGEASLR